MLCLLFGRRDPLPPPTVALVHREEVEAHRRAAQSFEAASHARVLHIDPEQPWPEARPPDVVVAVGGKADAAAQTRWPELPRASLLMFGAPPRTEVGTEPAPRLWVSAHTEPTCTARSLEAKVPNGGRWIVVATTDDEAAEALALALRGVLVAGHAGAVAKQLRARDLAGARVWVRAAPELAVPEWLTYLGRMTRLGHIEVGFDLPGGERFGLARWVEPDLEALGRHAATWADAISRRRHPDPLTVHPLPCLTPSTSDRLHD